MNIYLEIFITFFKIGLIGFGGGYAMIPVIQHQIELHGWLSTSQFEDIISVSAMAPGPIAANSATMIGYEVTDMLGAAIACSAIVLPSFLLIVIIAKLFAFQNHPVVISAFYGLRPVIVGIIIFAAFKLASGNGMIDGEHVINIKSFMIMAAAFLILLKTRTHPIVIIIASGIAGIFIYKIAF